MPCCCRWYYFTLNGWVIHFSKRTGHGSFNVALEGYYKLRDPSLPASFLWNYLVVIIKLVSCLFGQLVGLFMSGHRVSSNSNWHKYLINLPLFVPPSSHLQFPSPASLSLMGWQHPSLLQTEPPPMCIVGWGIPCCVFSIKNTSFIFSCPKSVLASWSLMAPFICNDILWCYELKPWLFFINMLWHHVLWQNNSSF